MALEPGIKVVPVVMRGNRILACQAESGRTYLVWGYLRKGELPSFAAVRVIWQATELMGRPAESLGVVELSEFEDKWHLEVVALAPSSGWNFVKRDSTGGKWNYIWIGRDSLFRSDWDTESRELAEEIWKRVGG